MGSKILNNWSVFLYITRRMTHSPPGAGAGKGGGAGGSIRESGGGLGKYGTAQEEGYFYNKTREEIQKLKEKIKEAQQQKQKKDD